MKWNVSEDTGFVHKFGFSYLQVKETEEKKQSETERTLKPKTEDVKLEANVEEEEKETDESKEKPKRPKKRRQIKKS